MLEGMPDSISNVPHAAAPQVFAADSAAVAAARRDSLDSVAASSLRQGIVLVDARAGRQPEPRPDGSAGVSWVVAALTLLFCVAGLRYKSNARYLRGLLREMVEVRERNNMFDDTVRETSFMFLLMLLCAGSTGMLLCSALSVSGVLSGAVSVIPLLVCTGCASAYFLLMPLLYRGFATVFVGPALAKEWVKGFMAGAGLLALPLFPAALMSLFGTASAGVVLGLAAMCFFVVKILFICRAFRIFMTESSSWVLFLYYLCTLEIIPLIITCSAARGLCASLD